MVDEEILDQQEETVTKDRKLRRFRDPSLGDNLFIRGPFNEPHDTIATDERIEWGRISQMMAEIPARGVPAAGTIAFVGAGFCLGPQLANLNRQWDKIDVYEQQQPIIDWNAVNTPGANRWNFIQGDYRQTMLGRYNVILYDAPVDDFDGNFLRSHLRPGGLLLGAP